jgi:hypothetical protein
MVGALLAPRIALPAPPTREQVEDAAPRAQNPVARVIYLQLQQQTGFLIGPLERTQHALTFQPLIPFALGSSLNLVTLTRLSAVAVPDPAPEGHTYGLGDTALTLFLSPVADGRFFWGVGPVFRLPTATSDRLGAFSSGKWSAGPSAAFLATPGAFVLGAVVNNTWSFAGDAARPDVNALFLQPFASWNLPHGWYLTSSPIITSNWEAPEGQRWLVPAGGGLGHSFRLPTGGGFGIDAQAFANVVRPDFAARWSARLSLSALLPKPWE